MYIHDTNKAKAAKEAANAEASTIATSAFVRGACGGTLTDCELTVTTKAPGDYSGGFGPDENKYRIVLGRVYAYDATQQNVAPEPVTLSEVCTGFPGSERETAVSCVVEAPAAPAAVETPQ